LPAATPTDLAAVAGDSSQPAAGLKTIEALAASTAPLPVTALQPLLQLAGGWLTQVARALANPQASPLIERDPASGQASLRLPLPEPDLLRKLADTLQALAGREPR
jgi:hypothetical protein